MAAPAESAARIESFLAIDGVVGGSVDRWHADEIEVQSFTWGVTSSVSVGHGGGGGAGKATFDGLTVLAQSSVASPVLLVSAASGKHHATAVLTVRRKGRGGGRPADFLTITLTDVIVTGYHQSGDEDRVYDEITLAYATITEAYLPQKPDGSVGTAVVGGCDVVANREL